jgi:hypothetical protein
MRPPRSPRSTVHPATRGAHDERSRLPFVHGRSGGREWWSIVDPNAVAVASLVIGVAALLVAVVAVPSARPLALVIALVGIGVAVYFLIDGTASVPADPHLPETPSDASPSDPSISVSPRSARAGDLVTVTGSGFPPDSGVAFRFANATGQDYPLDGFAAVDGDGHFRGQARLTAPDCDQTGAILVFLGTNDRLPDPSGPINQPVAEAPVTVACR